MWALAPESRARGAQTPISCARGAFYRKLKALFLSAVVAPGALASPEAPDSTEVAPATSRIAVYSIADASQALAAPAYERLLVGIILGGGEVGAFEVLRDGGSGLLVPLEPFAELSGCRLVEATPETGMRLETPLGTIELDEKDVLEIDGVRYLAGRVFEDRLASPMAFDEGEFALRFDLAWRPAAGAAPAAPASPLVPDVLPPQASLSTLRLDVQYSDSDLTGDRFDSGTLLAGRILGGRWQVRWQNDFEGGQRWQDYAWLRGEEQHLWLLGHQRVQLHPLLPGIELTGAQLAWTDQPLARFRRVLRPGELLPRRLRPVDSYQGTGPPAGLAELRIDSRVIARQTIGLDGRYAFYDVALPNRQLSQVEIYVYDRHNLTVPVAIDERSRSTSEFLLPSGAFIHQGGAGYGGNLAQDALDGFDVAADAEVSGFYQGRWGLRSGLTLEAAAQRTADRLQIMGGFVARLSRAMVVSLGLGTAEDAGGYNLELDGLWSRWRLRGRSQLHQSGFQRDGSEETFDHVLELGTTPSMSLDLALIARSRRQPNQRADFVLPALTWRPLAGVSLRARPDEEGDYVADLGWQLSRAARLAAHYQDQRGFLDYSHRLGHRYSLFSAAQLGGGLDERYSASLRRSGAGRWRLSWTAGGIFAASEAGFRVAASAALAPGVLLRLDWEDDPLLLASGGRRNRQLLIGVTTDHAWSRGRLLPARSLARRDDRGAIAGRVRIDAPFELPDYPLEDLRILLDGSARGRTQRGGSFFIANLPEGVYRLELDRENLPIELTPERVTLAAEVAAAAVTQIEFVVRPEFGLAGRVTDAGGKALAGVHIEILDLEGSILQSGSSDRFGLFRFDGLPIGEYTLRVSPRSFPDAPWRLPSRAIEIADDYLFGQDLRLPEVPSATPRPPGAPDPGLAAVAVAGPLAESAEEAPEPPASGPQGRRPEPAELVAVWARAWSEQRVDDYLGCYSPSFRPRRGMSRGDWRALRRTRLQRPRLIVLEISGLEVEIRGPARAEVRFRQIYRSDTYRDQVEKVLILVREDGAWRILEERVAEARLRPFVRE